MSGKQLPLPLSCIILVTPGKTTGYYKYPSSTRFFGRKISNVGGVNHRNKPAQRVPWRFLSLKKYKIVFFGPILVKL